MVARSGTKVLGTKGMVLLAFWTVACSPLFAPVVHEIDVTGLPFKGSPDAPVTVAVFSDYQ